MSTRKYLGENGTREIVGMVHDNAENISDLADITAELVDVVEHPKFVNTNELIAAMTSGAINNKSFPGDIIAVNRTTSDNVTKKYKWEVIGRSADGTNTLTLQLYNVFDELMNMGEEALMYLPNGLAAGCYSITFPSWKRSCLAPTESPVTIYFNIANAIAAGSQIAVYRNSTTGNVISLKIFASATAAEAKSTVYYRTTPEDGVTYTSLGTADGTVQNLNHISRAMQGTVDWQSSYVRAWLNDDKPASQRTWTAANVFSRKPATLADGFLYGWESWFSALLKTVIKRTYQAESVTENINGTYTANLDVVETQDKCFLPSLSEYGGMLYNISPEIPAEGGKYELYDIYPRVRLTSDGEAREMLVRSYDVVRDCIIATGADVRFPQNITKFGIAPCVVIGAAQNVTNTSIEYITAAENLSKRCVTIEHSDYTARLRVMGIVNTMYQGTPNGNLTYSNIRSWYETGYINDITLYELWVEGKLTNAQYAAISGDHSHDGETAFDGIVITGGF